MEGKQQITPLRGILNTPIKLADSSRWLLLTQAISLDPQLPGSEAPGGGSGNHPSQSLLVRDDMSRL